MYGRLEERGAVSGRVIVTWYPGGHVVLAGACSADGRSRRAKPELRCATPETKSIASAPGVDSTSSNPSCALVRQRVVASALAVTASGATTVAATDERGDCPVRGSVRC